MSEPELRHRHPSGPPVLVLAGFPDESDEVPSAELLLEIEEALLSIVRAALAGGRRLALPADPVVAPLVAQVAMEYAPPPQAEALEEAPRLVDVMFSAGRGDPLEEVLAGMGHVRTTGSGEGEPRDGGRHPLTFAAVDDDRPVSAVVIGGQSSPEDLVVLRELGVPLSVIGSTLAGPLHEDEGLWMSDVSVEILGRIGWEPSDQPSDRDDRRRSPFPYGEVPYPYLMQQLVKDWNDNDSPKGERLR